MAASGNARPYFGEGFCKNAAMAKVGCFPLRNINVMKQRKRSLSVIASASTPGSIDTINGRKINIGINGAEAPFMSNKNTINESGVDAPFHAVLLGRFVEDRFVYRQTFIIRSYEIGPDKTATMETLMNLLQVGSWLIVLTSHETHCLMADVLVCKVYNSYLTLLSFQSNGQKSSLSSWWTEIVLIESVFN